MLRDVGTWTNFCVSSCAVVDHEMAGAQQGGIFAALDCICFYTTEVTSLILQASRLNQLNASSGWQTVLIWDISLAVGLYVLNCQRSKRLRHSLNRGQRNKCGHS